jgi:hypothetical protein
VNRFDSDFVLEEAKKSEFSFFFKAKGKKRKCSIMNYRSFAITTIVGRCCIAEFDPVQQSWAKYKSKYLHSKVFVNSTSVVVDCRRVA